MVLAKIRRPSATPSARTSRSFSSRITSAASLATSVPESTEMPTSAACRARASLTPSPRNATPPPVRRWTRTMRALSSGLTRANTVVSVIAAASASSSRASRSVPVSAAPSPSPRSWQTFTATAGLSPVTTLTAMPRRASRRSDSAASCFGGSRNTRKPARCRSRSSSTDSGCSSARRAWPRRRRGCPQRTRPAAHRRAASGTSRHRCKTVSGAPFVTSVSWPRWSRSENRDHQPFMVERQHREPGVVGQRRSARHRGGRVPQGLVQRVPADAPPVRCGVFGAQQAPPQHVGRGDGVLGGDGAHVVDPAQGQGAGLVGEQHVDVAEIFDADQSFDEHLAAAHPA